MFWNSLCFSASPCVISHFTSAIPDPHLLLMFISFSSDHLSPQDLIPRHFLIDATGLGWRTKHFSPSLLTLQLPLWFPKVFPNQMSFQSWSIPHHHRWNVDGQVNQKLFVVLWSRPPNPRWSQDQDHSVPTHRTKNFRAWNKPWPRLDKKLCPKRWSILYTCTDLI